MWTRRGHYVSDGLTRTAGLMLRCAGYVDKVWQNRLQKQGPSGPAASTEPQPAVGPDDSLAAAFCLNPVDCYLHTPCMSLTLAYCQRCSAGHAGHVAAHMRHAVEVRGAIRSDLRGQWECTVCAPGEGGPGAADGGGGTGYRTARHSTVYAYT
eukprot:SAG31_NODE_763_length_12265_cov_3.024984_3_plen_153_part_00